MKAEELRIGNYIWNTHGFVQTISAEDILDLSKYENLVPERCQYFTPMLLKEDWLLKFGFEKVDKDIDGYYVWIIDHITIYGQNKGYDYNDLTNIQYVHQLQNLYFALTEKELSI